MNGAEAPGVTTAPERPRVSSTRLVVTLGGAGAFAGALIMVAFFLTLPAIEAHRTAVLNAAINEVLRGPARFDTLYVVGGSLRRNPPAGKDPKTLEKVYLGHAKDGSPVGYAVVAQEPGFQDMVRVIFGYDPATKKLLGMKVIESKETPGLGDGIEKNSKFVSQFAGRATPLKGVKVGAETGDPAEVDFITGATISSRTVVRIINDALARLGPALKAGAEAP
jgi:electron transport complex protein RnfG